jgi:hypothetical protein
MFSKIFSCQCFSQALFTIIYEVSNPNASSQKHGEIYVIKMYSGILFSLKEEGNLATFYNMFEP